MLDGDAGIRPGLTAATQWAILALLVLGCAIAGVAVTAGVDRPPDADALRDLGYVQGLLDGNWLGDPVYEDEWRWYPPLVHALGALLARALGGELPAAWVRMGPWSGLVPLVLFFLLVRRLFNGTVAAAASFIYVVVNSIVDFPWLFGGYSPWMLTPHIATAAFFAGLVVIHQFGTNPALRHAALIGAVIGIVALAHLVPALLLGCVCLSLVLGMRGVGARALAWLGVAAVVALVVSSPYTVPIAWKYGFWIANPVPGSFVERLLSPFGVRRFLLLNLPGVAGIVILALLHRTQPLERRTMAILFGWIVPCVVALLHHEACQFAGLADGACGRSPFPVHHFHLYLELAWACTIGAALVAAATSILSPGASPISAARRSCVVVLVALIVVIDGRYVAVTTPYAVTGRRLAMEDGYALEREFDRAVYRWIMTNTAPGDLFVTDGRLQSGLTVIAAGRRLVAAPESHSNPYVDWHAREALRRQIVAAAFGEALCPARDRTSASAREWILVERSGPRPPVLPVFESKHHVIYRLLGCTLSGA